MVLLLSYRRCHSFHHLQLLDPKQNAEELDKEYAELTTENLPTLRALIRSFFLKRTKAEVLTFLPPMARVIVPATMSIVRKRLYKSALSGDASLWQATMAVSQGEEKMRNLMAGLRIFEAQTCTMLAFGSARPRNLVFLLSYSRCHIAFLRSKGGGDGKDDGML